MNDTYLIQRLRKPYGSKSIFGSNPFSFGGGLRNGGLSDEAMDLLKEVFSFDYMGAAEFEFGAVPKALQLIAKNAGNYEAFSFTFPLSKVKQGWRDKSTEKPTGDVIIYVICNKADSKEVTARIKLNASNAGGGNSSAGRNLKEPTLLSNTLRPDGDWDPGMLGWLELDNGFFFFTDKEMWEKTAELFGVEAK